MRLMEKKTIWDLDRPDIETFRRQPKLPLVLVLDNVRSLNNIGSMFRTADAFAIQGIALCGISTPPPSAEIHKTALGAEDSVAWKYFKTTIEALDYLEDRGFSLCCLEQVKDSVSLQDFHPQKGEKYALVVGHEVEGVAPEVVNRCQIAIEIPQCGTKHSLNVAVSAGVSMWHFFSEPGFSTFVATAQYPDAENRS